MAKKLPIIAIVGRANVGKSSLFNAILDRREAIVAREAGTTRDSIMAKASVLIHKTEGRQAHTEILTGEAASADEERQDFWMVDTAGVKEAEDDFEFTIQEQIAQAADSADVIWVLVEADIPITEEDRKVAKMALKTKKPVFLIINKVDKARKLDLSGFDRLGIKPIIRTSTTHGTGIDQLLTTLLTAIPKATQTDEDDRLKIAILGRPNVGKSQLFNTLAKKQQAIVADRAGTTRDVNRTVVRYQGREVEILDTAGIRRAGKIEVGIERFSVIRALAAIEEADVCFMLMDVNELNVQLDQKIAGMVKEAGRGLVLVVSKWDAAEDKDAFTRDALAPQIAHNYDFVPWAPLIFTSAISGQNVTKLFDLAFDIDIQRHKRIATNDLNKWLKQAIDAHPPAGLKNRSPKLNYIVQEDDNDIPAFKIFGSQTKYVHWSYRRFLETRLRKTYGYEGTPIQLWFIEKHIAHKHGNSPTKPERSYSAPDRTRPKPSRFANRAQDTAPGAAFDGKQREEPGLIAQPKRPRPQQEKPDRVY
ncbi:MAG: small GTP-binding protein [Candidatus Saccharibacteria bacterium]|nr:small GTP-binding protein [Candidatus Saccharibacteria bacterium]